MSGSKTWCCGVAGPAATSATPRDGGCGCTALHWLLSVYCYHRVNNLTTLLLSSSPSPVVSYQWSDNRQIGCWLRCHINTGTEFFGPCPRPQYLDVRVRSTNTSSGSEDSSVLTSPERSVQSQLEPDLIELSSPFMLNTNQKSRDWQGRLPPIKLPGTSSPKPG